MFEAPKSVGIFRVYEQYFHYFIILLKGGNAVWIATYRTSIARENASGNR